MLVLFLLVLAFPALAGQSEAPAAPAHADVNRRINLDVIVHDKSGSPVRDLLQQDFAIFDNKRPQTIVGFQAAGPVAEIILLLDRVNVTFQSAAYERQQVDKFLQANGGHLDQPVSMIFFSDSGTKMQAATRDGNALIAAVNQSDSALRTIGRSQGIFGAEDRFRMSLTTLNSVAAYEEKRPGRKMLIWISPGWPLLSGPLEDLTNKQRQALFSEIVVASNALSRARVILYNVDPLGTADAIRTSYYKNFLKGVRVDRDASAGNLGLPVLAEQSGGRVLNSSNDLAALIESCTADGGAFYTLSFDIAPPDGPNEFHGVEVKVDKPGLKARTRTVYYAQP